MLEQLESVFSSAGVAEAAWIDLACASMDNILEDYWTASEPVVLDNATRHHARPWDRFKDWMLHLDAKGLAQYQLGILKQTSTVAACKADFSKLVATADLPAEQAVACWITGLRDDIQDVAHCFDNQNASLEEFQIAAAAIEANPGLSKPMRLLLSLLAAARANVARHISENVLLLASVRPQARVLRQRHKCQTSMLRHTSRRLRLASANASSVASLAT